jgi:hypothetical protein
LKLPFFCYSSTALAGGYSCVTLTLTLTLPYAEKDGALRLLNSALVGKVPKFI